MKKTIQQLLLNSRLDEAKQLIFNEINIVNNPDLPELYSLLGSAYAMEGNNQLALQYFNKAYELAPESSDILLTLCNFLIVNGDSGAASDLMNIFQENLNAVSHSHDSQNDKEEFNYFDFILNDNDAMRLEVAEEPEKDKTDGSDNEFSYLEYILGDIENKDYEKKIINQTDDNDKKVQIDGFNIHDVLAKIETIANKDKPEDVNIPMENIASDEKQLINIHNSNKKPRLLFTMYGWNESGGGTTFPKAFIIELAKRGFEVAVFYATHQHDIVKSQYYMEHTNDASVELYGVYNRPTIFLDIDNPMREIKDDNIVKLFRQVIDEFKPDLINFHNFLGLSFEIATVAKELGFVTTYTTYNYHFIDPCLYMYNNDLVSWKNTDFWANSHLPNRYPSLKNAYQKRIEKAQKLLTEEIDYTFAVSRRVRELLTDFCGNGERIAVINQVHQTIDTLLDNPIENHKLSNNIRFAFIGGVMPHKGAHIIAQAAQYITNKNVQFDIWGFCSPEYGNAIKAIDKAGNVNLKGEYTREDFRTIADNSDMAIIPSIWEDCAPLVLVECLAMNLPVIVSNIGGAPDFITEGKNGTFFVPGNPKALASVIQALLDNPFKIEQMREQCNVPLRFSDYVDHQVNIFNRLANGERPKAEEFKLLFNT